MAIKVKTGLVEQQKADASVFGYKQTYTSPLRAVSGALKDTTQAIGSIGGGMARERIRKQQEQAQAEAQRQRELDAAARKQAAVDKATANTASSQYGMGLASSIAAVEDAYALENDEAIAAAETELSSYDPSAANFTLDNYTKTKVSDSTYYAMNGQNDEAAEKYHAASLKLRSLRPHYQLGNILKTSRSDASDLLHTTLQSHLNQRMKPEAFDGALMSIAALGNHEGLDALSSPEAVTAFKGDASGMVAQLFIHNLENSRSVADVEYYSSKGVEQYGELLEFVNETDRESIIAAAEKRVEELEKDGNAEQRAYYETLTDQTSTTFLNTLSQQTDIQGMISAASNTAEALLGVEERFLEGADLEKYNSVKALVNFFASTRIQNKKGEDVVTSPFRQGLITSLTVAKQEGATPSYLLDSEMLSNVRPDDAGKLRQYVGTMATKIHKGLQDGDTRVLNLLTPDVTEQSKLLKDLGYRDMPLFNGTNVPWSVNDVDSSSAHIAAVLSNNTPAAVAQRGYNMVTDANATKVERAQGLNYQLASMAASPEEASNITKAMVALTEASGRFDKSEHTPIVQLFLNGAAGEAGSTSVMTSSEIYNSYKVALQTGDRETADAYQTLFQGLAVSVADAHADDLMGINKAGFFSAEGFTTFMAGESLVLRSKLMKTFFDKERELLTQRVGITRIAENDTKVTLLPSMLGAVDLEFRKPMNVYLESFLSADVPFTDYPLLFGFGPEQAEGFSRTTYSNRQAIGAMLTDGNYSVLPSTATNRTAEIYSIEVAQNGNLDFTPEMIKNIDKLPAGFRDMVEEFELATTNSKEELAEILQEGKVYVGGAVYPLLDYSAKSFVNNEIGIAVRYYDRLTGRYENLIDVNNNQVTITNSAAANRLQAEGGWVPDTLAESSVEAVKGIKPIITVPLFMPKLF